MTYKTNAPWTTWSGIALAALLLSACSLDDLVHAKLPPSTADPEALRTETGALAMYDGAIHEFRYGFGGTTRSYIPALARFTDEATTGQYIPASGAVPTISVGSFQELDTRDFVEDYALRTTTVENWYRQMNLSRNMATDAMYLLRNYAPRLSSDLVANLYGYRGYSMIFVADALCSGIPLTEYRSPGGWEYKPGSTTKEVYEWAVAQFDSGLAEIKDSTRYVYFLKVGKARALLNLGRFDEAAAAVADVPTTFKYQAMYEMDYNGSFSNNWAWGVTETSAPESNFGTVADRKGTNGLPYRSANDPRVKTIRAPYQNSSYPLTTYYLPAFMFPTAAPWGGTSTEEKNGENITFSDGIEARLDEAEILAAKDDPAFLTKLNTLRTTCTVGGSCATPAPAGTGGVAGLPPLSDPGTKKARLKLVLDERGWWRYLTGLRQGDLRRYVRLHGFNQSELYPVGFYPGGLKQAFGTDVNIPVPGQEKLINTKYTGCFNRDA